MAGFPITSSNPLGITIDPSLLSQPSSPNSMAYDIPLEPSSEEWYRDAISEMAFHLSNAQSFEATQSTWPSPQAQSVDFDVQIRAHTQPPEDIYSEASADEAHHQHNIHHSRPPHSRPQPQHFRQEMDNLRLRRLNRRLSRHQISRSTSSLEAHRPLSKHRKPIHRPSNIRLHRPQAPTSMPSVPPNAPFLVQQPWTHSTSAFDTASSQPSKNAAPSDYPDLPVPPQRIPHTSFSLRLESQLAHLQHVLSSIQTYLSQSYKCPDDDEERTSVENTRLLARTVNRTLTELHETLIPLPRHPNSTALDLHTPATGAEIREMNHSTTDALLDSYDIAFTPTMFLWEKKAMYLRFVGAGRALMHRVLD